MSAPVPSEITPGYRFRDPWAGVCCVLIVNRKTKRATVIAEQPGGDDPLDVLRFERILTGKRLPRDTMRMRRHPCGHCGRGRQDTVAEAAKLARKLGVTP